MLQQGAQCPCGSGKSYGGCCGPFIAQESFPSTPEQLMRSRFSAFFLGEAKYLTNSTHPPARGPQCLQEIHNTPAILEWHSLIVIASTTHKKDSGFVEFVAFYTTKETKETKEIIKETAASPAYQTVEQLHEYSSFIRENGRWYYQDGKQLAPYPLGRNDPCWCGSGLKFKKCHKKLSLASQP